MGEPAGCPGAPVGGHQARNTDRRARGNSVRPSGRGPQRSGLWTGSYPKDRRRHEQPAPTLPPERPHQRQLRRGSDPTRRDPHRGHFHARATIPRMRWLVGILWGAPVGARTIYNDRRYHTPEPPPSSIAPGLHHLSRPGQRPVPGHRAHPRQLAPGYPARPRRPHPYRAGQDWNAALRHLVLLVAVVPVVYAVTIWWTATIGTERR